MYEGSRMKIGFIGLGLMGVHMSRNLIEAGHSLIVWNRTSNKMDALAEIGAVKAASPKELASQSELIVTIVTDSADVEEVVLGADGVIHGANPGTSLIDMSTISPSVTQNIAEKLSGKSIGMLDAPVSGGVVGAENGTLSIMVGGPKDLFDKYFEVFNGMGKRITYCGSTGMGQVTKLVNQIMVVGTMAAVSEGLVFAARAGADLQAVFQAVSGGAANSWQLENLGSRILNGDFAPGFRVRLQQKDLRLILEAAREMSVPLFTSSIAHQLYGVLEREGCGEEGTQAYVKVLEKLAGVTARTQAP
jgi:3-hydroxyisobutyrate dehydrogenase